MRIGRDSLPPFLENSFLPMETRPPFRSPFPFFFHAVRTNGPIRAPSIRTIYREKNRTGLADRLNSAERLNTLALNRRGKRCVRPSAAV